MARKEVLVERLCLGAERLQVFGRLVFVSAGAVKVVHEYVLVAAVDFEHPRTFHADIGVGIGINKLEVLLP